jgi:hypothetical protein
VDAKFSEILLKFQRDAFLRGLHSTRALGDGSPESVETFLVSAGLSDRSGRDATELPWAFLSGQLAGQTVQLRKVSKLLKKGSPPQPNQEADDDERLEAACRRMIPLITQEVQQQSASSSAAAGGALSVGDAAVDTRDTNRQMPASVLFPSDARLAGMGRLSAKELRRITNRRKAIRTCMTNHLSLPLLRSRDVARRFELDLASDELSDATLDATFRFDGEVLTSTMVEVSGFGDLSPSFANLSASSLRAALLQRYLREADAAGDVPFFLYLRRRIAADPDDAELCWLGGVAARAFLATLRSDTTRDAAFSPPTTFWVSTIWAQFWRGLFGTKRDLSPMWQRVEQAFEEEGAALEIY